jgi:hypothetical protein
MALTVMGADLGDLRAPTRVVALVAHMRVFSGER